MKCPECGQSMEKETRDYRYTESGLSNVTLKNVQVYRCPCGNEMVEIPTIERVHQTIAEALFKKPALLTGEEIRFLRKEMGLRSVKLAHLLGVSKVTVSRWENQAKPIGPTSDRLIRSLYLLNVLDKAKKKGVIMVRTIANEDILKVIESITNRPKRIKIEVSQKDLVAA